MKKIKKTALPLLLMAAAFAGRAHAADGALSAVNMIDWQERRIDTTATLDAREAGIILPEGRETAAGLVRANLPDLTSAALFSVTVDSSTTLGAAVREGDVALSQALSIIDGAETTHLWFSRDLRRGSVSAELGLSSLEELFVQHQTPYRPKRPLESIATRAYSGIVIDARGQLPIHGEFTEARLTPALFPKVWSGEMNLVYERNMVSPEIARQEGIVAYATSPDDENCIARVGPDPLYIRATGVYGIFKTDAVIARRDYLRILCDEGNLRLLEQGKVAILCDEDVIRGELKPQEPLDDSYYFVRREIERALAFTKTEGVSIKDGGRSVTLTIYGIRFVADSPDILPEEEERIAEIALTLAGADPSVSFLVEGHTAAVGRPAGELELSIERAEAIARRLEAAGIAAERISTAGYGGTRPVASNSTGEGRAQNRRVEITVLLPD